jgi:hypothetical protein
LHTRPGEEGDMTRSAQSNPSSTWPETTHKAILDAAPHAMIGVIGDGRVVMAKSPESHR